MKLFLIFKSKDDQLNGKRFSIENTAIKTMHIYPEFSNEELRVKSFDGIVLKMSNPNVFLEAKLLRKI